jgi:hypothetical protein
MEGGYSMLHIVIFSHDIFMLMTAEEIFNTLAQVS